VRRIRENIPSMDFINEFVLDRSGKPPNMNEPTGETDFYDCLSIEDVFQGRLGDCFLVGTLMGILKNRELLAFVIPSDNAIRQNIDAGAFHFRFWSLCEWHDVVVDDFLPTYSDLNLLFSRNLNFRNEFWVALIEKAIAK
jgi:hypothetical protein